MSWTILAAAVLIYGGILVLLRVYESRLIYFPGPERTLVATHRLGHSGGTSFIIVAACLPRECR